MHFSPGTPWQLEPGRRQGRRVRREYVPWFTDRNQGSYLPALHFGSVPDPPEEISEKFRICVFLVREYGHFGPKNIKIPEIRLFLPRFLPEFPGSFPISFRNFSRLPPAYFRKMSISPPFQKIQTKIRPLTVTRPACQGLMIFRCFMLLLVVSADPGLHFPLAWTSAVICYNIPVWLTVQKSGRAVV